jgi:type I restriction enzyme S subunit
LTVPIPPLPEQHAIAHILGTLDDKIELNRRMSETLEAMARALFKAWFVDFEPVRAKMEGRWERGQSLPGLPAHLYDLFPDRLVDSELGEIPEGWRVGRLGDLALVTSGKRPNKVYPEPQSYASIPLWGGNGPMGYVTEPLYSTPILLTGRVGTLGSVFRIATPCWPSDNTLVVIAREKIAIEFLYFQMKRFDYDTLNRGSTQPLLTQTDLNGQQIPLPSNRLLSEFHKHVSTYFAKLDESMNESRTLAALRDALLPKLISGELRVKNIEEMIRRIV